MPSTVAASLASMAGSWKPAEATSGPSKTRSVEAASAASVVHTSHGPRGPDGEVVQQVVTEPHRIEAHRLGGLRHADHLRKRNLPLHLGQLDSDEQWSCHGSTLLSVSPTGRMGRCVRLALAHATDLDDRMENR